MSRYAKAAKAYTAQKVSRFVRQGTLTFHKRAGVSLSFAELLNGLAEVIDRIRNAPPKKRDIENAQGAAGYDESFAYVDEHGVGLYVFLRDESGGEDGPTYHYYKAASVGLADFVFAADLAAVDEMTFCPFDTKEILEITYQAYLVDERIEEILGLLVSALFDLGYTSERGERSQRFKSILKKPVWPAQPGQPLQRLTFAQIAGSDEPSVSALATALARAFDRLSESEKLAPIFIRPDGNTGLANYCALTNGLGQGLLFSTNWVDVPEQHPRGWLEIYFRAVGLPDLFITSERVFIIPENGDVQQMRAESYFVISLTGANEATRYEGAIRVLTEELGPLGYALQGVEHTTAGCFP